MEPIISVVMPVYNAGRTVEAAALSVLGQTEGRFELLAVDDGSDDASSAILERLARSDARVRLVRTGHGGIVAALERGLSEARGRYIARMDADDLSLPTRFERQIALLERRPDLGVVACKVEHREQAGQGARGYGLHVAWLNDLVTPEAISLARFVEAPVAHPSVMFRRELLERLGGYRPGPFPEDYELWLRWMAAGVRFGKVPDVLYVWSDSPDRLSRTDPRYDVDAFFRLKAGFLAAWLQAHNPLHPEVVIWGAGKSSRRRAAHLEPHGCHVSAYVDIDPRKVGRTRGGRPVLHVDRLGRPGEAFVVSYVGKRGARSLIRSALESRGFVEGEHYLLAS